MISKNQIVFGIASAISIGLEWMAIMLLWRFYIGPVVGLPNLTWRMMFGIYGIRTVMFDKTNFMQNKLFELLGESTELKERRAGEALLTSILTSVFFAIGAWILS